MRATLSWGRVLSAHRRKVLQDAGTSDGPARSAEATSAPVGSLARAGTQMAAVRRGTRPIEQRGPTRVGRSELNEDRGLLYLERGSQRLSVFCP